MKPRSCYREDGKHKIPFISKREAKTKCRKGQLIYECWNCGFFHIASKHH